MPLSTVLLLACLTVLKWLCLAIAVLLFLLMLRAQFDAAIDMPLGRGLAGAGIFLATGIAIHLIRDAIVRRTGLGRRE